MKATSVSEDSKTETTKGVLCFNKRIRAENVKLFLKRYTKLSRHFVFFEVELFRVIVIVAQVSDGYCASCFMNNIKLIFINSETGGNRISG